MTPQLRLFGWCSPSDQYHSLCRVTHIDSNGVTFQCSCPRHHEETSE